MNSKTTARMHSSRNDEDTVILVLVGETFPRPRVMASSLERIHAAPKGSKTKTNKTKSLRIWSGPMVSSHPIDLPASDRPRPTCPPLLTSRRDCVSGQEPPSWSGTTRSLAHRSATGDNLPKGRPAVERLATILAQLVHLLCLWCQQAA